MSMLEFGAYLRRKRAKTGWDQFMVAQQLVKISIPCSRSSIQAYEQGKIANPDPEVIKGLAQVYDVPLRKMVAKLVLYQYGIDFAYD